MDEAAAARLEAALPAHLGARSVRIQNWRKLSGGAIQENWSLDVVVEGGPHEDAQGGVQGWVLRTDSPSSLGSSHGRALEYRLLQRVCEAGVTVATPVALVEDPGPLGRPFFLMRRVGGTALGPAIVRSDTLGGGRAVLVASLGRELARIHSIRPPDRLEFLQQPTLPPALHEIALLRQSLDQGGTPRPVVEWALRALERGAHDTDALVLCHNDFRTGNFMIDETGITAILDWEFAGWGDRHADLGWLCARCWRFGNRDREVGGIGERETLYDAYETESGVRPLPERVRYWELLALARWAMIAAEQGRRVTGSGEPSLELALTAHMLPDIELDILAMTREMADA